MGFLRRFVGRRSDRTSDPSQPESPDALYAQAIAAFEANEYAKARPLLEQVVARVPDSPNAQYVLGYVRLQLADFRGAVSALATCLEFGLTNPLALHVEVRWAEAMARMGAAAGELPPILALDSALVRSVSVIICSVQPERFEKVSACYHRLLAQVPHEIVGIHDALSLCEGYNRGISRAGGDYLIFSHDDIDIEAPDFAARLLTYLARFDMIGVAGTTQLSGPTWQHAGWPHLYGQVGSPRATAAAVDIYCWRLTGQPVLNAEALDGVFLAARRCVVERVTFDERTFDGWHLYDIDFTYRARQAGFRIAICDDLFIVHQSRGSYGPEWKEYAQRFLDKYPNRFAGPLEVPQPPATYTPALTNREWRLMTAIMALRLQSTGR